MTLPQTKPSFDQSGGKWLPGSQRNLIQAHKSSARWLQVILDMVLVVGLLYFHTWFKGAAFDSDYRSLAILTVTLMAVVYNANNVYRFSTSLLDRCLLIGRAWTIVLALIVLAAFLTKTSTDYSREVFLRWALTGFIAQILVFMVVRQIQTTSTAESLPTLIIGSGSLAQQLATHINNNPWIPDQVIGLISEDETTEPNTTGLPMLGELNEVLDTIAAQSIRRVYLAMPMHRSELVEPLYLQLADQNVDIIWAPDIFSVDLLNHSIRELNGIPIISMSETPLIGSSAFIKTVMDFSIATGALIVASPVMLITALLIKLTSPGPILFSQKRHGWNGEIITIYKFRSMKLHDEADGTVTQASKTDDRVTWIGKIIRRTSIDELPQLFNVINGSMSIVGPRPHAIAHNEFYGERIKDYLRRHRVKPGLTGLAQVNGFRGETKDIEQMEGRVQHDLM